MSAADNDQKIMVGASEETKEVNMGPEEENVPASTPVTSEMTMAFQNLRSRFNEMIDEISKGAPVGGRMLRGKVRCFPGCNQGEIE